MLTKHKLTKMVRISDKAGQKMLHCQELTSQWQCEYYNPRHFGAQLTHILIQFSGKVEPKN